MLLLTAFRVLSTLAFASAASLNNSQAYSSGALGVAPYQTFNSSSATPVLFNFIEYPPQDNGHIFIAPRAPSRNFGASIFDHTGELVWDGASFGWGGFAPWTYKGKPVLVVAKGQFFSGGYSHGDGVILDQSYNVIANISTPTPGLKIDFHEIAITKDDTAIVTIYDDEYPVDLTSVGGPKDGHLLVSYAQEIDIETGKALWTWKSSDHVAIEDSYATPANSGDGTAGNPFDFFHINSIEKDDKGNFLVSSRHTSTIFYLSGQDGSIIWRLGGKKSDFVVDPKANFSWQHHARFRDANTLSLFDNAASGWVQDSTTRGLLLYLNSSSTPPTADLLHEAYSPIKNPSRSQGNYERIDNGWVVGWGQIPYISGHSDDGTRTWSAQFGPVLAKPGQIQNYRAYQRRWVGYPTTQPSLVVNATHGAVSWNGATEVAAWEIIVGGASTGKVQKTGFETTFKVPGGSGQGVQVKGIAADGSVLGASQVKGVGSIVISGHARQLVL